MKTATKQKASQNGHEPQTLESLSLTDLKCMIADEHEIMMAHEAQFKAHQANWIALRQERARREQAVTQ